MAKPRPWLLVCVEFHNDVEPWLATGWELYVVDQLGHWLRRRG